MAKYDYEALSTEGTVVKGAVEVTDEIQLRDVLRSRNLYLYRSSLSKRERLRTFIPERLRMDELIFLLRQLASLLNSGIALHESLVLLQKDNNRKSVSRVCQTLAEQLVLGRSLSQAFRTLTVSQASVVADWLEIGEEQGDPVSALETAADQLDDAEQLRQQFLQQLLYPFIVFLMVLGVGALLSFFVLPALAHTYLNLNVQLPFFMTPLLLIGEFFHQRSALALMMVLVVPLALAMVLFYLWYKGTLRLRFWQMCLRLPILRRLIHHSLYIAFARSLGRLLSSGVRLSKAFDMLAHQKRFHVVLGELAQVQDALLGGSALSRAVCATTFVPQTARRMIETGEQTGTLPSMLMDSADHYERYLKRQLALLVRVIEPLSIAFLGLMVLFMALSFFLPLLQSYRAFLS